MLLSSDIIWLHQFHIICSPFLAGRYHSLVIEKESFPDDELEVTAWTEDGLIMAARHKKYRHMQVTTYLPVVLICHGRVQERVGSDFGLL